MHGESKSRNASEVAFIGCICQWSGSKPEILSKNCKAKDKNPVSLLRDFTFGMTFRGCDKSFGDVH